MRGDDTAGASLIKKWLTQHNVGPKKFRFTTVRDFRGLDFVTPESFGRAFIYAAQSPFGKVFADSLPIAGTDGTLGGRMGQAKGKIIAKTGSISFVNSLAGYAAGKNETFAFVIVVNNETRKGVLGTMDKAAMILSGIEAEEKETENQNKTSNNANSNQQNDFYNRSIANQ